MAKAKVAAGKRRSDPLDRCHSCDVTHCDPEPDLMSDLPGPTPLSDRRSTPRMRDERPTRVRYRRARLPGGDDIRALPGPRLHRPGRAVDQGDLGICETRMGLVFAAFTLAYAVFEIPTGRWGDRYGSRGVLTRIVLWWSVFTALTGAAPGLGRCSWCASCSGPARPGHCRTRRGSCEDGFPNRPGAARESSRRR